MRQRRLSLIICAGFLALGCGDDDGGGDGGSGSSGSDTGMTTASMTTASMTTASMTTASMTTDGTSTGMPPDDTGSTTAPPADSSGTAGEMTSTTGDSGSGTDGTTGGGAVPYPPCDLKADPVCPEPYTDCYPFAGPDHSVCYQDCRGDDDCPQPTSGDAPAVCGGVNADQCVLDCSDGETCPDDMECVEVAPNISRCAWPN